MSRRTTESRASLVKKIVDIDVRLAAEDLTDGQKRELRKQRDKLERRIYGGYTTSKCVDMTE